MWIDNPTGGWAYIFEPLEHMQELKDYRNRILVHSNPSLGFFHGKSAKEICEKPEAHRIQAIWIYPIFCRCFFLDYFLFYSSNRQFSARARSRIYMAGSHEKWTEKIEIEEIFRMIIFSWPQNIQCAHAYNFFFWHDNEDDDDINHSILVQTY